MTGASAATVLLAMTFLAAALAKLRAPLELRSVLRDLVPDGLVWPLGHAVPVLELALAAALLSSVANRAAAIAAGSTLLLFSAALVRMWQLGISQDCGCFGESSYAATPVSGVLRNMALIGLAVVAALGPGGMDAWTASVQILVAHLVLAAAAASLWSLAQSLVARRQLLFTGEE